VIPLTPSFLIAAASAFVGIGEQGGENRGQVVETFLKEVDLPAGLPWCAAFVHHVGYWSHYDFVARRSSWPLPRTASCWELGDFARRNGLLEKEPLPGDVFLLYDQKLKRFAHTGIVVSVKVKHAIGDRDCLVTCTSIEGNTNEQGEREGTTTRCREDRTINTYTGDRFIRWSEYWLRKQKAA